MVAVFSIFATLSMIEFKVFGVAMAAAIAIDATVVRGVLLPAGLALLGDRAWAMPSRPRFRRQTLRSEVEPRSVQETMNVNLGRNGRDLG
jgi:RND superfamily putative drug exporter